MSYQGSAPATLIPNERRFLVDQRSYAIADLSAGFEGDGWTVGVFINNLFDKRADVYRFAQCPVFQPGTGDTTPFSATVICGTQTYIQTNLPRTIGVKFGQKF